MVWPFGRKKSDNALSDQGDGAGAIPIDPIQLRSPEARAAAFRDADAIERDSAHQDVHPVAKIISEIGEKIGLRSEAIGGNDRGGDSGKPDSLKVDCGASMSVMSQMTFSPDSTPKTEHTLHLIGRVSHEQKHNVARNFTRLVERIIKEAGGTIPRKGKTVLGEFDNRSLKFEHDDVTREARASGARSVVERRLGDLRDMLNNPDKKAYLEQMQNTMMVASVVEEAFSKKGEYATRIEPTYGKGDMGEPVFGMSIETNHPALKEQFTDSGAAGLRSKPIGGIDGAFVAVVDGKQGEYQNGIKIKAEGHQGLMSLVAGIVAIRDKPEELAQSMRNIEAASYAPPVVRGIEHKDARGSSKSGSDDQGRSA